MYVAQPIEWTEKGVVMLDQRRLPAEEISYTYTDYREVAKAIREMVIRGAPAIGVAAAMGVALGVQKSTPTPVEELKAEFARDLRDAGEDAAHGGGSILGTGADEAARLQELTARRRRIWRGFGQAIVNEAKGSRGEKGHGRGDRRFGAEYMPKEGR